MFESQKSSQRSEAVTAQDLLDAANDASSQSRNMWLAFLFLLAYLIVTIGGTTHQNLLLNNPVKLPFLNVEIPLFSFFIYGPLVVLVFHLGVLIQHAMLAFKLFRFTELLHDGGWHRQGSDPRRGKLHAYIVSQLIAGPDRGPLMGFLMRLMTWISLVALPVITLLFFQIAFLPFHDVAATYWHRIAVFLDCLILFALWPYMRPATKREAKAKARSTPGEAGWPWRVTAVGFGAGGFATLGLLLFSWFVATIPDSCLFESRKSNIKILCLDKMMAHFKPWTVTIKSGNTKRDVFWLTALLFEGGADPVTGQPASLWSRNIVLTDSDLVPEKDFSEGEVSLSLRGRDLRYAVLDRTDLHRTDFTGVDLRGASLKETRLEQAKFCLPLRVFPRTCSEFQGADLKEANLMGVDFWGAKLEGAQLAFVKLEGADFRNAQLEGANLSFAELKGADLSLANLKGAKLSYAKLQRARLSEAELQQADITGANLQGANFTKAQLEGADLSASNLQAAEMSEVKLQGANLSQAQLEGADLRQADLRGTNLKAATMKGADLRFSQLWLAKHPGSRTQLELTDLRGISFVGLSPEEKEDLKDTVEAIDDDATRKKLLKKLNDVGLLADSAPSEWPELKYWKAAFERFQERDDNLHAEKFNHFWTELACQNTNIVESISERIGKNGYFANQTVLARNLTSRTCDAAHDASEEAKLELCRVARWTTVEDRKDTICN